MQPQYNLIAFPVSQSWDAGSGRKIDPTSITQFIKQGSSWTYQNKQAPRIEYIPSKDTTVDITIT